MATHTLPDKLDVSHASPEVAQFVSTYLKAKTDGQLEDTMQHFSPDVATYSDAVMGWAVDSYDEIYAGFAGLFDQPAGSSYPTDIMGSLTDGDGSALVAITNTPEIVGSELHMLVSIDVRDNKIVRQVDYWDSTAFDDAIYADKRTASDRFPREYKENVFGTSASPIITEVATALQSALSDGNAAAAAELFGYDALLEDMSLRVQVIGKAAVERYFQRTLETSPLGIGSRLRHVVGGELGGGFEWHCRPGIGTLDGITALELNGEGQITRATTVYDGRQLEDEQRRSLISLSTMP